jgi:hypothetical protein
VPRAMRTPPSPPTPARAQRPSSIRPSLRTLARPVSLCCRARQASAPWCRPQPAATDSARRAFPERTRVQTSLRATCATFAPTGTGRARARVSARSTPCAQTERSSSLCEERVPQTRSARRARCVCLFVASRFSLLVCWFALLCFASSRQTQGRLDLWFCIFYLHTLQHNPHSELEFVTETLKLARIRI